MRCSAVCAASARPKYGRARLIRASAAAGLIITSALIIWKTLMVVTGSESPVRARSGCLTAARPRVTSPASRALLLRLPGRAAPQVVVVLSGSMEPSFYRGAPRRRRVPATPRRALRTALHETPFLATADAPAPGSRARAAGDILFLYMGRARIAVGEIVVFNIVGRCALTQTTLAATRPPLAALTHAPPPPRREIPIVHRVIAVHDRAGGSAQQDVLTKGDNNFGDDKVLYAEGQSWLHREHIMGRAVGYLPHVGRVTIIMNDYPYVKARIIHNQGGRGDGTQRTPRIECVWR